ncbi:MAG: hypothetical protein JWR75_1394 [Devosia sp.]|nr:hypothetical protein [Devosia sp.]
MPIGDNMTKLLLTLGFVLSMSVITFAASMVEAPRNAIVVVADLG